MPAATSRYATRYLERAEYTCRIVEVHLQLLLDDPSVDQDAAGQSLLEVMGCPPPEGSTADAQYVLTALCYDAASPASVAAFLSVMMVLAPRIAAFAASMAAAAPS